MVDSVELANQPVPQTRFGSYFEKGRSSRLGLLKMEVLPEQKNKRSISKNNKKGSI